MVSMNILTKEKRIQVLRALVEGNSIRATVRITGVAKNTVVKLLRDAGRACEQNYNVKLSVFRYGFGLKVLSFTLHLCSFVAKILTAEGL